MSWEELMAELESKVAGNVDGRFYVDEDCIDCGVCIEIAPENFAANEDEGHAFVAKQPTTDEGIALCLEAIEECPVDAIGDDS